MRAPTDSQWAAIRDADRHLLVSAGAGTGKTTTVVGRILYLLGVEINGRRHPTPVRLRDVAAITFTNAAAADLKRKLRRELRAAGRRAEAYEVDGARIGTIHGFCGDILREFALRAGRDPGARVLDEGEGRALVAEAVREAVLAALDGRAVEGLDVLLAERGVGEVEGWACRLLADGDRLERLSKAQALDTQEATLVRFALHARDLVEQRLEKAGAVDFDRMIVWTRDLLAHRVEIRRALQRRLRMLVVDEFQDVDPVQKEIAYLLGEPATGRADTPRLLLVGDPKQSIYRFRRADVTVWTSVEREFTECGWGGVVALEDNFRSVPPVLAFVDAAIGPILDAPLDGERHQRYEIGYRPVRAQEPAEPVDWEADPAVDLIVVPCGEDGKLPRAAECRVMEAAAVARRAVELRDRGVRPRDMAVLLASWSDLDLYQRALERAGLPTYAVRGDGFYGTREVQDLILALEAVRDPRDDRALVGFLRSPFAALRDETLLHVARQVEPPYWDRLCLVRVPRADEQARLGRAAALLREHAALRDRIPAHELLERLLVESGYLAHLALLGMAGEQRLANVRKFLRQARSLGELSVGDLLRVVRETRDRGDREGEARLYGERDDVVTITSIHSSKGLEWEVVFWCDLNREGVGVANTETLLVGRDQLVLKQPDVEPKDQPLHWQRLKEEEEREMAAERKRLWYVAATRAKRRLVLSGLGEGVEKDDRPGGAIWKALGGIPAEDGARLRYVGQGGRTFSARVRLAEPVPAEEIPESAADAWGGPLPGAVPGQVEPLAVPLGRPRHSATALMGYARCARRHWFRYVAGLAEPEVDRRGGEFIGALVRGQIVHDVLEHAAEADEFEELLEAAIGRWDENAPAPETARGRRYREHLRQEVKLVQGHPDYRALADDPTARRELAFLHVAGPDAFLEGKIDLAARGPDGLVLLDVKTYQGDAEAARARARDYALQRDAYVLAAERIAGAPVSRFAFHFSRSGVHASEPIGAAERRAGAETIGRLLAEIGVGAPALTRHPAECRFCGYKRVGWCEGVTEGPTPGPA